MRLQFKLSLIVIVSIVASIILACCLLLVYGKTFTRGYHYEDLDKISDEISQSFEGVVSVTDDAIQQLLSEYVVKYKGIDFEWVRMDGSLIYSSSGRLTDYTFEEMADRFRYGPQIWVAVQTFPIPYKINIGSEQAYLILTLQENATRNMQVLIFAANWSTFLIYLTPILLIVLIPLLSSVLYSAYVNRRIQRLRQAMQQTDLNNLEPEIADRSKDEIGQLVHLFHQMAQKINDQYAQIRQVERQRKQLVSNLSHDLRMPLTLVLGYAENLVRRDAMHDPLVKQWHAIILDKSRYIMQLLTHIFEVSLSGQQQLAVSRETCNLTELISQIVLDYAIVLEEMHIEPDIRIPPYDIGLSVDAFQIERVVRNLIDNAIKYGASGHYLGVYLEDGKDRIALSVRDRGIGIPAEEQSRIFEPFYRLEKGRSGGSIGMGLPIVADIINAYHGTVSVVSEPYQMTVFTIELSKN